MCLLFFLSLSLFGHCERKRSNLSFSLASHCEGALFTFATVAISNLKAISSLPYFVPFLAMTHRGMFSLLLLCHCEAMLFYYMAVAIFVFNPSGGASRRVLAPPRLSEIASSLHFVPFLAMTHRGMFSLLLFCHCEGAHLLFTTEAISVFNVFFINRKFFVKHF